MRGNPVIGLLSHSQIIKERRRLSSLKYSTGGGRGGGRKVLAAVPDAVTVISSVVKATQHLCSSISIQHSAAPVAAFSVSVIFSSVSTHPHPHLLNSKACICPNWSTIQVGGSIRRRWQERRGRGVEKEVAGCGVLWNKAAILRTQSVRWRQLFACAAVLEAHNAAQMPTRQL